MIRIDNQNRITIPVDLIVHTSLEVGTPTGIYYDPDTQSLYFDSIQHQKEGGKCVDVRIINTKNRICLIPHVLSLLSKDAKNTDLWLYLQNDKIHISVLKRKNE